MQSYVAILLATGVGAGFASGLLGVGGSFIMVPVIFWLIEAVGFPDVAMKVALGTSLLVVLPTAMSGVWRHNKKHAVLWKAASVLGSCGLAGALAGSTVAAHLPGYVLEVGFGGVLLAVALWMGLGKTLKPASEVKEPRVKSSTLAACGFPIGIISGLAGLGGGVVMVPVMVMALNFPMHLAVGTSTAAMLFTSLGGIIGYVVNGIGVPGIPPYSTGYINLPVWLCLAATSVPMAQLGARTAHVLPAKQLRYVFVALTTYLGLRMIGVLS
jgi:uncharacterized protein